MSLCEVARAEFDRAVGTHRRMTLSIRVDEHCDRFLRTCWAMIQEEHFYVTKPSKVQVWHCRYSCIDNIVLYHDCVALSRHLRPNLAIPPNNLHQPCSLNHRIKNLRMIPILIPDNF